MRDILFFKFNTLTVQDMYKTCTSHVFQHKIADKATSVRLCIDIFKKTLNEKIVSKAPSKNEKKTHFILRILYTLRKSMARKKSGLMITLINYSFTILSYSN